jgi:hypothetical protein
MMWRGSGFTGKHFPCENEDSVLLTDGTASGSDLKAGSCLDDSRAAATEQPAFSWSWKLLQKLVVIDFFQCFTFRGSGEAATTGPVRLRSLRTSGDGDASAGGLGRDEAEETGDTVEDESSVSMPLSSLSSLVSENSAARESKRKEGRGKIREEPCLSKGKGGLLANRWPMWIRRRFWSILTQSASYTVQGLNCATARIRLTELRLEREIETR